MVKAKKVDADGNPIDSKLSDAMQKKRKKAYEAMKKKAILVTVERSVFANFIFDATNTDAVCKANGISDHSFIQIRKCCIHPKHVERIMNITNDAIMLLWNLTRPWDNNDFRLLPMEFYDDFTTHMQKLKDDHEEAVDTIVAEWDNYVAESKKTLGKFFNKNDYPSAADIKNEFRLNIITKEIPDMDDIRFNLSEDELVDMEKAASSNFQESFTNAQKKLVALMSDFNDIITNGTLDKKTLETLANIGGAAMALNINNDPDFASKINTFLGTITCANDECDLESATKSDEELEKKQWENASESEMMVASDEELNEDW